MERSLQTLSVSTRFCFNLKTIIRIEQEKWQELNKNNDKNKVNIIKHFYVLTIILVQLKNNNKNWTKTINGKIFTNTFLF